MTPLGQATPALLARCRRCGRSAEGQLPAVLAGPPFSLFAEFHCLFFLSLVSVKNHYFVLSRETANKRKTGQTASRAAGGSMPGPFQAPAQPAPPPHCLSATAGRRCTHCRTPPLWALDALKPLSLWWPLGEARRRFSVGRAGTQPPPCLCVHSPCLWLGCADCRRTGLHRRHGAVHHGRVVAAGMPTAETWGTEESKSLPSPSQDPVPALPVIHAPGLSLSSCPPHPCNMGTLGHLGPPLACAS